MLTAAQGYRRDISFGDCDPAGIVYYPNILAWVDGAYHHYLRRFGGHFALGQRRGSTGIGAVDVKCQFKRPLRDGDSVLVDLTAIEWSEKTFVLRYDGRTDDGVHFLAEETRGIFIEEGSRLILGSTAPLRALLEQGDG